MRVTYPWLREFVDIPEGPEAVARRLTMLGFEVEEIIYPKLDLEERIVVGEILEARRHEKVDRLWVCKVNVGERVLSVVCGAPNVRPHILVPVALEGARLPTGKLIERSVIQGQASEGMICSEAELGLSLRSDEIMILDSSAEPGVPLAEFLGEGEVAMEIAVMPNRPDALGVVGIAREIATSLRTPLRKPLVEIPPSRERVEDYASVEIVDVEGCPRYSARVITGVRVGPSPRWLVQRLTAAGLRCINNVVDVTNYVMVELGHPLHAFDYDLLAGHKIVVRRSRAGERFVTLDGQEHTLNDQIVLICDAEKPVAVAGIMGGANSEVSDSTRNILLESAYFNPMTIRRGAKFLEITTEASRRFERGMNPNGTVRALDRAAQLIAEIAGGSVLNGVLDCYPQPIEPPTVPLRLGRVKEVLGAEVPKDDVVTILSGLECQVQEGEPLRVTVPTFRPDLTREIDLIEEIARVYGYDRFSPQTRVTFEQLTPRHRYEAFLEAVRSSLVALGLQEVVTYSMVHSQWASRFSLGRGLPIRLKNPISEEQSTLRPSLIPGLLQVVRWNKNRQIDDIRIFEVGDVFWSKDGEGVNPEELSKIGLAITGAREPRNWKSKPVPFDFWDLKGLVEAFLRNLHLEDREFLPTTIGIVDDRALEIAIKGKVVGFLGAVGKEVREEFDLRDDVLVAELDVEALFDQFQLERRYQSLPKFPSVRRDVALVVDRELPAQRVEQCLRRWGTELLGSVELFDVYTGEPMPPSKKSLAFSLTFLSLERTLTEEEVDGVMQRILDGARQEVGAQLRR